LDFEDRPYVHSLNPLETSTLLPLEAIPVQPLWESDETDDSSTWPVWTAPENRMLFQGSIKQAASTPAVVPFMADARILVDSGCDGMVMSEQFALANGIPTHMVQSRVISMADDSKVDFSRQCTVRNRVLGLLPCM
jgi:hypothetical protein